MAQNIEVHHIPHQLAIKVIVQIECMVAKRWICVVEIHEIGTRWDDTAELFEGQILKRRSQHLGVDGQQIPVLLVFLSEFLEDFPMVFLTVFGVHFRQNSRLNRGVVLLLCRFRHNGFYLLRCCLNGEIIRFSASSESLIQIYSDDVPRCSGCKQWSL